MAGGEGRPVGVAHLLEPKLAEGRETPLAIVRGEVGGVDEDSHRSELSASGSACRGASPAGYAGGMRVGRQGWWAWRVTLGVVAFGCNAPPPSDLCAKPPTEEVAWMCATDLALADVGSAGAPAAITRCDGIPSARWSDECVFRVAEAQAKGGDVPGAWRSCAQAGAFARMCIGHAAWLRSAELVEADSANPGAQAAVDALIASLPVAPEDGAGKANGGPAEVVRAAAWHGIYAGTGRADPTAARAASPGDAPLARGAFAWEASRLLAADGDAEIDGRVLAAWRGEAPVPEGAALPESCWEARIAPRFALGRGGVRSVRTWAGGERFVSAAPEADLRIATLEARWAAGVDLDPTVAGALLVDADPAVALTGARHVGTDVAGFPTLPSMPEPLAAYAREVRAAVAGNATGRVVVANGGTRCGG